MSENLEPTADQPLPHRPLRRWSIGLNVMLQLILTLALFGIGNYASYHYYARRDLSPSRDYSLSPSTIGFLRKLSKEVTITLVFTRDSEIMPDARALVEECRRVKKSRIHVEEIDPARDLERAEELKLRNNITLHGNGILVRAADRIRFIGEEELLVRGASGDRERPSVDFLGEDALVSAILGLIEGGVRRLYFITGKGAAGGRATAPELATLADIGRRQNIETAPINLTEIAAIPDDADGVVLAAPRYDLSEREMTLLQNYWEDKRAALLVLLDPNGDTPRLRGFLAANGVAVRPDRVLYAESTSAGPRKEFSVQAEFTDKSPVSKPFVTASTQLRGQTQSLDLRGDTPELRARHIEVLPLLDAAQRYWGETRYFDEIPRLDTEDAKPPVHLAASVERGAVSDERLRVDSSRMVVAGNATLLDPATRLAVDQDFISACLNWMMNRKGGGGATPKRKQMFRIQLTGDQHRQLFQVSSIFLPGIALAIGFMIWSYRRA